MIGPRHDCASVGIVGQSRLLAIRKRLCLLHLSESRSIVTGGLNREEQWIPYLNDAAVDASESDHKRRRFESYSATKPLLCQLMPPKPHPVSTPRPCRGRCGSCLQRWVKRGRVGVHKCTQDLRRGAHPFRAPTRVPELVVGELMKVHLEACVCVAYDTPKFF